MERAIADEITRARKAGDQSRGEAAGLERVLGYTGVLGEDSRRLVRLVNGLLDVTRIATGKLDLQPEDLDFRDIVTSGIDAMRPELAQRRVPLTFDAPEPLKGRWDRLRLEQVVANLLSNAVKYGEGRPIAVCAQLENDEVLLIVEDKGQGVDPVFAQRMFNRFEHGAAGSQGLGLGLYITRQIVDDDPRIVDKLAVLLASKYETEVASNGFDALARLNGSRFDALLLDLRMPGLDGPGLVQELTKHRIQLPIILMSANPNLAAQAASLGIRHYLGKPFDIETVERMIDSL